MGRVYVIQGADGLTLIDTSLPGSVPKIARELEAQGFRLSDVKRILITHAHQDHVGSLGALQNMTSAQTYVQFKEALVVIGKQRFVRPRREDLHGLYKLMAGIRLPNPPTARVDREIVDGEALDEVLPGLTVVDLPGHAPGQIGFWYAPKRLLIAGDALMHYAGKLRLPFAGFTADMAETYRSIHKIADMDVDILCIGHGAPLIGNAGAAVREFASRLT